MKTFIYTKEERPAKFYRKLIFTVYRITKNKPVYIGVVSANTGSYRGDDSTVMNYLISLQLLPKKEYGYYSPTMRNAEFCKKNYVIYGV